MKAWSILVAGFLTVGTSLTAVAATYVVSTDGNNSNPGTAEAPFKTIQKAADVVSPGDEVIVMPGDYVENIRFKRGGDSTGRITFRGGGQAKTDGFFLEVGFLTLDGFVVEGITPVRYDSAFRLGPGAHETWILNCRVFDIQERTFGVSMLMQSGGVKPEHGARSCIFSNNVFDTVGHINMNLMGSNHLAIANTFYNSYGEGDAVRVFGVGHRIVSNVMTNLGKGHPGNTIGGHVDLLQTFGDMGHSSYNMLFERNLAINCDAQFCQLEQKGVADIRDFTFRNNVFVRMKYAGHCDLPGVKWHNNTFYKCTPTLGHVVNYSDGAKGIAWRSEGINNVFLECGSNPANDGFGWYIAPDSLTDLNCDYNYVSGTPNFAPKRTAAVRSPFRFVEAHGINGGDPGFVSITSDDFHLKPGSQLIGAGKQLDFDIDFYGNPRVAGAWDVGAIAFPRDDRPKKPEDLQVIP